MLPAFASMKDEALQKLDKNWGTAVLGVFLVFLISGSAGLVPFGSLVVGGPLTLGMVSYFLRITRNQDAELNHFFEGFKNFGNALGAYILIALIVLLFTLLLIVPGIMAALALSQTFRIMREYPELSITDAMRKSRDLMNGYKMDYFLFNLSFIGWAILCILTLGLGFLVLIPYVYTSNTIFYNHIAGNATNQIEGSNNTVESIS